VLVQPSPFCRVYLLPWYGLLWYTLRRFPFRCTTQPPKTPATPPPDEDPTCSRWRADCCCRSGQTHTALRLFPQLPLCGWAATRAHRRAAPNCPSTRLYVSRQDLLPLSPRRGRCSKFLTANGFNLFARCALRATHTAYAFPPCLQNDMRLVVSFSARGCCARTATCCAVLSNLVSRYIRFASLLRADLWRGRTFPPSQRCDKFYNPVPPQLPAPGLPSTLCHTRRYTWPLTTRTINTNLRLNTITT